MSRVRRTVVALWAVAAIAAAAAAPHAVAQIPLLPTPQRSNPLLPTTPQALPTGKPTTATPESSPDATATSSETGHRVELDYDRVRSRALFHAVDLNADDRLTVLEAGRFLGETTGRDRVAAFRAVDANSDGFVEWPEFDARYRASIDNTGRFEIRLTRPLEPLRDPAAPAKAKSLEPTLRVLSLVDADENGTVAREEFVAFIARVELPGSHVSFFPLLDVDQSGELSPDEFGPVLKLPGLPTLLEPKRTVRESLPDEYQAADADADGVLTPLEIAAAVRRIDPSLARWADRIVRDADRNGTGSLGAPEIRAATPPTLR